MPTHTGKDNKGCYAQWGGRNKYYYKCGDNTAKNRAIAKANKQGQAIRAAGFTETTADGDVRMSKQRFKAHHVKTKDVTDSYDLFADINESSIDKEKHIIKKVCVFGTRHSLNGYTYQDSAISTLHTLTEGAKLFINHPSKSESKDRDGVRDVRDWAGVYTNASKEDDKVFADLYVRPTYWELVKDVAMMKPKGVGNSINSRVKVYQDDTGHEHIVDIDTLHSIDLVASAATTQNLFESKLEDKDNILEQGVATLLETDDKTKQGDLVFELLNNIAEGLLADKIKERQMARKISELSWQVSDTIDDIIRDKNKDMATKKTEVTAIMDDYETMINAIMAGGNPMNENFKQDNEEEEMDYNKLTLEELKKERPDVVENIVKSINKDTEVKTLKDENDVLKTRVESLTTEKDETNTKLEAVTKERDDLKKKVDEYEVSENKTKKETFIADKIKEMKLVDEAITETFKEDLMTKDEDGIVKSLEDRKALWEGRKTKIKNSGEEFKPNDEPTAEEAKAKVEAAKEKFKSTIR